ncbi:MAG: YebC/PmpR family DNA-binding transcriptional regulator [Crocinitomicaceae bacterium]|nr:YebC/PmpR family DNA-binding transcriptional regulator [Crocinitomicaceae bacterium]|tara:strand:- start:859 stop:1608 length:750 start_codon:yes stop_codon:yes gene_type:complete
MAGHSKWANIKHRKAAQDKKRAKVFTRAIKEITIAARDAGGDIETNPSLRLAVQNAKGANMPKDTIERAIKKGIGGEGANLVEITFEGYASKGIAIFVEATTDNNNRTVASVRSIFNKYGGSLGTNGSLGFLFERKGIFTLKKESIDILDLEEVEMELIDFGLEELTLIDDEIIIQTTFDEYGKMQTELDNKKWTVSNSELQRIPIETSTLSLEDAQKVMKLIDKMEEDDDVNAIYHNLELTEELMDSL